MRTLTCIHHPKLRWLTKQEAVTDIGQYTGARNILFQGEKVDTYLGTSHFNADGLVVECSCAPTDLRFAPEDKVDY